MFAKTVVLASPAGAVLGEPALFRALSAFIVARLFALAWRHRHIGMEAPPAFRSNFTTRKRDRDIWAGDVGQPPRR